MSALLVLLFPWCLVKVIDIGLTGMNGTAVAVWLSCACASLAVSGIVRYYARRSVRQLSLDAEKQMLRQLYASVFRADLRELPDHAHGKLMGQILSASSAKRTFVESVYEQAIPIVCTTLGTFGALLALDWPLALICCAIIPFSLPLFFWMRRRIRPAARKLYESQETMFRSLVESFRAMIPIRALHQTERFQNRFDQDVSSRSDATFDLQNKMAVQGPFLDILQATVLAAVFGIGSMFIFDGTLTVGILVGFQIYLARMFGLVRSCTGLFSAYQHYIEGLARADEITAIQPASKICLNTAQPPYVLQIEHLRFGFGDHVVWDDASLSVKAGHLETILLPSGAGKTTLARCILGLYPVWSGTIAIPGGDPKTIGFVPQDNVLFDGTLLDNISLMCPDLPESQYRKILSICALDAIAERFADTTIGEQGAKLSGGEQRRVMLARALASAPKLLIIDQMVSELEPDLCRSIFAAMRQAYPEMGILYLGHRMPEIDYSAGALPRTPTGD